MSAYEIRTFFIFPICPFATFNFSLKSMGILLGEMLKDSWTRFIKSQGLVWSF